MVFLKILAIAVCGIIAYQDIRHRMVLWITFPLVALALMLIHVMGSGWESLLWFSLINLLLVSGVLLMLYLYTRLVSGKKFLNTSLGLGDVLLFYAFSLGFPTLTFVILFVGSILFSLFVFLVVTVTREMKTVPLAGYMSIFLIGTITMSFFPNAPNLYVY